MQLYAEKDRNDVPVIKKRTGTAFRCVRARNELCVHSVIKRTVVGQGDNISELRQSPISVNSTIPSRGSIRQSLRPSYIYLQPGGTEVYIGDGQIPIAMGFKSRFEHIWGFDLNCISLQIRFKKSRFDFTFYLKFLEFDLKKQRFKSPQISCLLIDAKRNKLSKHFCFRCSLIQKLYASYTN